MGWRDDPRTMVAMRGAYLAGLVDGEGCFYIGRNRQKATVTYQCGFCVKLRADDTPLLEYLAAIAGVGRVKPATVSANQNPQALWAVTSKPECLQLCRIFEEYPLRSKKARDFAVWRDAVDFWVTVGGRGTDWTEMEGYFHAIRDARAFPLVQGAGTHSVGRVPQ